MAAHRSLYLSGTNLQVGRKYFPNATIVADRFNVPAGEPHHFLKLWRKQDPFGRKDRGLLSVMHRHQWHLSADQRDNLNPYLPA